MPSFLSLYKTFAVSAFPALSPMPPIVVSIASAPAITPSTVQSFALPLSLWLCTPILKPSETFSINCLIFLPYSAGAEPPTVSAKKTVPPLIYFLISLTNLTR